MKRVWYGVWTAMLVGILCAETLAGIGTWKIYTSKREVRDLTVTDNMLWVVTSGGLHSYSFPDKTFHQYTTPEGLLNTDCTAVEAEPNGNIWIGTAGGIVQRFIPGKNEWASVTDLSRLDNPQKRINALVVANDTLFILSDVGLSLFSLSTLGFGDTYSRFGAAPSQLNGGVTAMARWHDRLWVGTRQGIVSTSLSNPAPLASETWQLHNVGITAPPAYSVTGLVVSGDMLFAATNLGLAVITDSSWSIVPNTAGLNIRDLALPSMGGCASLFFLTESSLWSYTLLDGVVTEVQTGFSSPLTVLSDEGLIGSQKSGVVGLACPSALPFDASGIVPYPPGPHSNKFVSLAVDGRSAIWSGTGKDGGGEGFMGFDGTTWRSYTVQEYPQLGGNDYYMASIGLNDSKWISSWGQGVAHLDADGNIQQVFNTTNGIPPTFSLPDRFVAVGGVAVGPGGITWITNRTGPADTSIVKYLPDGTFEYVVGCGSGCQIRHETQPVIFTDVTIDYNGTKWFSNYSYFESVRESGVFYYNESINLPGTFDGWGKLTTAHGLASNRAYSIAVDREGDLWIGSDNGVTIIYNPLNPTASIAAYHPPFVERQVVHAIAVDAMNNKWVATRQGVFVLSPDGTALLEYYTVKNTNGKLIDDNVASLVIDPKTGIVYMGTERGLSTLETTGIEPEREFSELTLAPNPFILPASSSLAIRGLVAGSLLKVMSIDGNVVRETRTPGGNIGFWDGRDNTGSYVASGVYIVVAYSEDGAEVANAKVAVIRR